MTMNTCRISTNGATLCTFNQRQTPLYAIGFNNKQGCTKLQLEGLWWKGKAPSLFLKHILIPATEFLKNLPSIFPPHREKFLLLPYEFCCEHLCEFSPGLPLLVTKNGCFLQGLKGNTENSLQTDNCKKNTTLNLLGCIFNVRKQTILKFISALVAIMCLHKREPQTGWSVFSLPSPILLEEKKAVLVSGFPVYLLTNQGCKRSQMDSSLLPTSIQVWMVTPT